MYNYEDKIISHQKIDFNEVEAFLNEQIEIFKLKNYVQGISTDNNTTALAYYDLKDKHIRFSGDYELIIQGELLDLLLESKKKFSATVLHDNDVYNLFIINTVFHELRHVYQNKVIDTENTSLQSLLFELNFSLVEQNREFYQGFHNRYYVEYDAIINAIKNTLKITQKYDFSTKALYVLNQYYAKTLLSCYGLYNIYSIFNDYPSPIDFTNMFLENNFKINKNTAKKIKHILQDLYIDDFKEQLLTGYNLSFDMMETLFKIKDGKLKTKHLLQELDIDENIKVKTLK